MAIKHIILKEGTTQLYPNAAYPVGYIYMSTESTSPATLFGGTWVQISGYFLYGYNQNPGATGGADTVALNSTSYLPSHAHTKYSYLNTNNTYFENAAGYTNYKDIAVNSTGSNSAHNNLPPYYEVYCWRKSAD